MNIDIHNTTEIFKHYLRINRKIEPSYIKQDVLIKELLAFKQSFPLKTEVANQEHKIGQIQEILSTEQLTEREPEKVINNDETLINEFQEIIEEYSKKEIINAEELKHNADVLKKKIVMFNEIME